MQMCQADESNLPLSPRTRSFFDSLRLKDREKIAVMVAIFGSSILIGLLSINRQYFTFTTETDFVSMYIQEARKFLTGEPLLLAHHPPLYPIVLAQLWRWTNNWFQAGLLISWLSASVSLASAFFVFLTLYGRAAAWGSLVGLLTSCLFLTYAAFATTDVFFLAIFYSGILLSLLAAQTTSTRLWCAAGLVLGFSLLTRSNSVSLLTLLSFPLLQERRWRHRLFSFGFMVLFCLLPLAMWGAYASSTGSPLLPTSGLADNLAMTYFADRSAGVGVEAMSQVMGRFESVIDVLAFRPYVVAYHYLHDLGRVFASAFHSHQLLFVLPPLNLLAFSGLIILVFTRLTKPAILFLTLILFQVALVNFKTYEDRFYLFLVPVLGAAAGTMLMHLYHVIPTRSLRLSAVLICTLCFLGASALTVRKAHLLLHAQDAELSATVQAVRNVLTPGTLLVARKGHIAYYTGSQSIGFPESVDLDGLREALERDLKKRDLKRDQVLLYFGSSERFHRPHLIGLSSPATAPSWLELIAHGSEAGGWVLYRVLRDS
jgi:hypothetical protein